MLLRNAIAGQVITRTIVLSISTADPGSPINIPLVQKNANATNMDAIFWLGRMKPERGRTLL